MTTLKLQLVANHIPERDKVKFAVVNWAAESLASEVSYRLLPQESLLAIEYAVEKQFGKALRELINHARRHHLPKLSQLVEITFDRRNANTLRRQAVVRRNRDYGYTVAYNA
jgi:citrate lyase gamma subunit